MSTFNGTELRVVISVSGGVADEVLELSRGPVEVYIVDFDNLNDSTPEQVEEYISGLPEDIQEWVRGEL
jgi:hypothetical protein